MVAMRTSLPIGAGWSVDERGCSVDERERGIHPLRVVVLEPVDVRVALEPADLPPGVAPGELLRLGDGRVAREFSAEFGEGLGVADRTPCGDAALEPRRDEAGRL